MNNAVIKVVPGRFSDPMHHDDTCPWYDELCGYPIPFKAVR